MDAITNRASVIDSYTTKEILDFIEEGERDLEENAVFDFDEVFDGIERGEGIEML